MGERSGCVTALLISIAIILIAGFYLSVNAIDLQRLRTEELSTDIGQLRNEVSQMRNELARRPTVVQVPAGTTPSKQEDTTPAPDAAGFANADLRDPNAVDGGRMISAVYTETHHLNPLTNNEASVSEFWGLCNDTLAERSMKDPTVFQPMLATHWEISDDKLTYTLHMRKNVFWHDVTDPTTGTRFENVPVTAHDVKFYVDVIKNPGVRAEPARVYFEDLKSIEALDDYTLQVTWAKPYFRSLDLTLGLMPLPRHFYAFDPEKPDEFNNNAERNRMIIGCGPYMMSSWEKGKEIVFVRNERYYGPKPYLLQRRLKVIKDHNARLEALKRGEIDRMGLNQDQWTEQTDTPEFKAKFNRFKYTSPFYVYVGYNLRKPLFADRKVRLALTHCIDRKRILRDVYRGLGRIVTGNFFIDSPYYDHTIEPWPFDVDRAKVLLAEAGWTDTDGDGVVDKDGKPFEFTFLSIAGSANLPRIAAIMKNDLAKAGIRMNITDVEWSVYTQRLEEQSFDVCALGWSLGYESDPYQVWHSSQADLKGSSNHIGFKNAEADEIIIEARREFDLQKRIKLYNRFHAIMHEEQPYTFLLSPYALVAQDKRYRNAKVYPLGMHVNSMWVPIADQKR